MEHLQQFNRNFHHDFYEQIAFFWNRFITYKMCKRHNNVALLPSPLSLSLSLSLPDTLSLPLSLQHIKPTAIQMWQSHAAPPLNEFEAWQLIATMSN
jgi:hypothetical protein